MKEESDFQLRVDLVIALALLAARRESQTRTCVFISVTATCVWQNVTRGEAQLGTRNAFEQRRKNIFGAGPWHGPPHAAALAMPVPKRRTLIEAIGRPARKIHRTMRHEFPIGRWPGPQWTIWLAKEIARIYFAARRCGSAKKGPRSLPPRTIDGPRVPKSSYDRLLKDCRLLAPEEGKSVGFVEYLKSCFNISAPRKLDFAVWGLA
jgi:hypothetical protein